MAKKTPYYANWYKKNRDRVNARRRERYGNDKRYRDHEKDRARAAALGEEGPPALGLYRDVHGNRRQVFTVGEVATELEVSTSSIRYWQAQEWVPAPMFEEARRLYTRNQINLMKSLSIYLKAARGKLREGSDASVELERKVERIWRRWEE